MNILTGTRLYLCLHVASCLPGLTGVSGAQASGTLQTDTTPAPAPAPAPAAIPEWSSPKVQHGYGLPETKANQSGQLILNSDGVTFVGKSSRYTIPRNALLAVSAGNERVELWGMKGRLLRMAIPNGGGVAVAGVMHHKVNMLSVEFQDPLKGYHAAVFYLPAGEAEHVIASFAELPPASQTMLAHRQAPAPAACPNVSTRPHSVQVFMPDWNQAEVPAAYRALVYEHVVERMQHVPGITRVYREGEDFAAQPCPQYTLQVTVSAFRAGSQVKRSVMGPVGMFVGTTQMQFSVQIKDATGAVDVTDHLKATVRGESESKDVAVGVAKTIAKHFSVETQKLEKLSSAQDKSKLPS